MAPSSGGPDWTRLPDGILLIVLQNLSIPEILRSAAVCTTWCSAVAEFRLRRLPPHQAPWLEIDYSCGAVDFYSFSEERDYSIPVPFDFTQEGVIGTSHGWLIITDEISNLILINPITGSLIDNLPPVATLADITPVYDEESGDLDHYEVDNGFDSDAEFIHFPNELSDVFQVVFSSHPLDPEFGVWIKLDISNKLGFARPGDESWSTIVPDTRFYHGLAFHEDNLCLVSTSGLLRLADYIDGDRVHESLPRIWPGFDHLVTGPCGEIFLVKPNWHDLKSFTVYRVDGRDMKKVVEVNSLGNYAFLADETVCLCVSCTEFPEFVPSRIYHFRHRGEDVGTYNVEDGTFQLMFPLPALPPIWFIPSLE